MPDYADDILKDIANLQRSRTELLAASQKRPPITKASAGWEMPNRIEPDPPADGAHIYALGDELRWKSADGQDYSLVPVEVPVAPAVDNAGAIVSGSAPADYNQTWGQNIYEGLVDVKDQLNALMTSLRSAGLLND